MARFPWQLGFAVKREVVGAGVPEPTLALLTDLQLMFELLRECRGSDVTDVGVRRLEYTARTLGSLEVHRVVVGTTYLMSECIRDLQSIGDDVVKDIQDLQNLTTGGKSTSQRQGHAEEAHGDSEGSLCEYEFEGAVKKAASLDFDARERRVWSLRACERRCLNQNADNALPPQGDGIPECSSRRTQS